MAGFRTVQVTFDCLDAEAQAAFWCEVLGHRPEGHQGPRLFFQTVPEGKTVKNHLHLDVRAVPGLTGEPRMAALDAERDRLVRLGARQVRRFAPGEEPGSSGFIWMEDPEGNEFCLDRPAPWRAPPRTSCPLPPEAKRMHPGKCILTRPFGQVIGATAPGRGS